MSETVVASYDLILRERFPDDPEDLFLDENDVRLIRQLLAVVALDREASDLAVRLEDWVGEELTYEEIMRYEIREDGCGELAVCPREEN